MKKKYAIEEIVPEFRDVFKLFERSTLEKFLNDDQNKKIDVNEFIKQVNNQDSDANIFWDYDAYYSAIQSDKETLINYLKALFECFNECYEYYEHGYCRFGGGRNYLSLELIDRLYVCMKYFESIKDEENANRACFLLLASIAPSDRSSKVYDLLEHRFKNLINYFEADWLTVHPQITCALGKYYLKRKEYKKAKKFFLIGSKLDYDGRQSIEPFVEVGKNKYELGMLYYKGLLGKKDYKKALKLFNSAAEDFGEPSLPIIGDMYLKGQGVKKNKTIALKKYLSWNSHNEDIYIDYKWLNKSQKKFIISEIEDTLVKHKSVEKYIYANYIYKNRIYDKNREEQIFKTCYEMIDRIPPKRRTDKMNHFMMEKRLNDVYRNAGFNNLNTEDKTIFTERYEIPNNLKVGDTFFFGVLDNEPVEWKVWDINEDGSFFLITAKIIAKMDEKTMYRCLNDKFFNALFTIKEQAHIRQDQRIGMFLYPPKIEQCDKYEGTYPIGTIKETEFAKSICSEKTVISVHSSFINEDGTGQRNISPNTVRGIRPCMDVFPNIEDNKKSKGYARYQRFLKYRDDAR